MISEFSAKLVGCCFLHESQDLHRGGGGLGSGLYITVVPGI